VLFFSQGFLFHANQAANHDFQKKRDGLFPLPPFLPDFFFSSFYLLRSPLPMTVWIQPFEELNTPKDARKTDFGMISLSLPFSLFSFFPLFLPRSRSRIRLSFWLALEA